MVTRSVRATRSRFVGQARRFAWDCKQQARQAGDDARALLDSLVDDSASEWQELMGRYDAIAARYAD